MVVGFSSGVCGAVPNTPLSVKKLALILGRWFFCQWTSAVPLSFPDQAISRGITTEKIWLSICCTLTSTLPCPLLTTRLFFRHRLPFWPTICQQCAAICTFRFCQTNSICAGCSCCNLAYLVPICPLPSRPDHCFLARSIRPLSVACTCPLVLSALTSKVWLSWVPLKYSCTERSGWLAILIPVAVNCNWLGDLARLTNLPVTLASSTTKFGSEMLRPTKST